MSNSEGKVYITFNNGETQELKTIEVTLSDIDIEKTENSKFDFKKGYSGTFENVTISPEFEAYLEKQRKLIKREKARERLYRDIERWNNK